MVLTQNYKKKKKWDSANTDMKGSLHSPITLHCASHKTIITQRWTKTAQAKTPGVHLWAEENLIQSPLHGSAAQRFEGATQPARSRRRLEVPGQSGAMCISGSTLAWSDM
jgi:hypothetical protein